MKDPLDHLYLELLSDLEEQPLLRPGEGDKAALVGIASPQA